MFRRLRYGLRLLGLRMRRRSYAWTRRLPRAAVRNMGLFYGGLILGALLLTVGRFYPGFTAPWPLAPSKARPPSSPAASS